MQIADSLRKEAGIPDCEYGIEVAISCGYATVVAGSMLIRDESHAPPPIPVVSWISRPVAGLTIIGEIASPGVLLPRLSFGPISEINRLITLLSGDIYDAAGYRVATPFALEVVD
jgi:hypothetical protein